MTDHILRTESDRARIIGYLAGLDLEKPRKIVIKNVDRSAEQNAKLHAMLSDIAAQVEHAGRHWDALIWKRLLTAAWLRDHGEQPQMIPALDGNGVDVVYERTSKLSVGQCADLISWIQAFGDENSVRWSQKDLWGARV